MVGLVVLVGNFGEIFWEFNRNHFWELGARLASFKANHRQLLFRKRSHSYPVHWSFFYPLFSSLSLFFSFFSKTDYINDILRTLTVTSPVQNGIPSMYLCSYAGIQVIFHQHTLLTSLLPNHTPIQLHKKSSVKWEKSKVDYTVHKKTLHPSIKTGTRNRPNGTLTVYWRQLR